ncbi:unnamed protein product [Protopolystoma xenopodis]|uniref:Uncharacterized protein n=1 Tax=Protopolystoma xenopodis TaxID=117903 RepID=A0A3S5B9A2_9PLAT|nr:unnamed protein product [Protopolystoma xenopodis]
MFCVGCIFRLTIISSNRSANRTQTALDDLARTAERLSRAELYFELCLADNQSAAPLMANSVASITATDSAAEIPVLRCEEEMTKSTHRRAVGLVRVGCRRVVVQLAKRVAETFTVLRLRLIQAVETRVDLFLQQLKLLMQVISSLFFLINSLLIVLMSERSTLRSDPNAFRPARSYSFEAYLQRI